MRKYGLSGNVLKWIAAIFMVIDHVGVILFPEMLILRILGRISFPIFAFMIAEGCRYTRNKARYLLTMLGVGSVCQIVLFFYNRSMHMNVLLTFSLSALLIFSFAYFKEQLFAERPLLPLCLFGALVFSGMLAGVILLGNFVELDYGVAGCMVPLFAALLHPPKGRKDTFLHRIDYPIWRVLTMGIGLLPMSLGYSKIQYFCLLSLPLLMLYSGKRGKYRMKYFFYVFYPAHLLLIQGIAYLFF